MTPPRRVQRSSASAGIMMFRRTSAGLQVLLVHPGGPYWQRRDAGAWSIPKGEYQPGELPEIAARREFEEELGVAADGTLVPLGDVQQRGGKRVAAFALEGDLDSGRIAGNLFEIEWPPRSGHRRSFPEVDRAEWFTLPVAREKLNPAQGAFLDRLQALIDAT